MYLNKNKKLLQSLAVFFFPRSHKMKLKAREGRFERVTLADFYSSCKWKHFKVSILKAIQGCKLTQANC